MSFACECDHRFASNCFWLFYTLALFVLFVLCALYIFIRLYCLSLLFMLCYCMFVSLVCVQCVSIRSYVYTHGLYALLLLFSNVCCHEFVLCVCLYAAYLFGLSSVVFMCLLSAYVLVCFPELLFLFESGLFVLFVICIHEFA